MARWAAAAAAVGALVLTTASADPLSLVTLSPAFAAQYGAACLDGTPPAYWIQSGSDGGRVWVIFAEGGGWCFTPDQCASRAAGYLGSSKGLAATFTPGGIDSSVPSTNPHFANATHVFLHYCDGASFASNASAQGQNGLWHRGRPNLAALFGHLAANQGLATASEVIFSGGSAGALAAYLGAVRIQHA